MKKIILLLNAAIALCLSSSCTQMAPPETAASANGEVLLTVGLENLHTKGQTAWTKTQEDAIESWQVFVFNDDGSLDVSGSVSGNSSTVLKCTSGHKSVYALVNHPSSLVGEGGVSKKAELLAVKSKLSDNSAGERFVMFGSEEINISASSSLEIKVDRLCSKIYIDSIENQLSGSYGSITVKGVYVTNAAGDAVIGNEAYIPESTGSWYNKMGYSKSSESSVETMLSEPSLSEVIAKGSTSSTAHYFYCYPNKSTGTQQGGTWSPRCSRLVVETVIEGDSQQRRYYVIDMVGKSSAVLERNKYYHIKKLTINHLGSTDPDEKAEFGDITVSVTVSDWGLGMEEETIYYEYGKKKILDTDGSAVSIVFH